MFSLTTFFLVGEKVSKDIFLSILKINFIYFCLHFIFIAAGGLFLVAGSWGYSLLRYSGFSTWRLLLLWSTGLVVSQHVESSRTRDPNRDPCIGRQILNHWTTQGNLFWNVFNHLNLSWFWHSPCRRWHPTPVLLPGKSHGRRSPVGCSPWGCSVGQDWATSLSLFTFMHWRRKWQPTPVFLPGESQGRGSLVGCRLQGRTESDTTEAT